MAKNKKTPFKSKPTFNTKATEDNSTMVEEDIFEKESVSVNQISNLIEAFQKSVPSSMESNLSTFFGVANENVTQWTKEFKLVAKLNSWNENKKLNVLISKIAGAIKLGCLIMLLT